MGHRPELDGLRGLSVLVVIGFHALIPGFSGGFIGVDAFFVLSGFLITSLIIEERRATGTVLLKRFYLKRLLRLLPGLLVMVLVVDLLTAIVRPDRFHDLFVASLYALFYVSNWVSAFSVHAMYVYLHTWSLSIEEQFYLLLPPLLLLIFRFKTSVTTQITLLSLGVAASFGSVLTVLLQHGTYYRVYNGLDTRGGALLIGCLVGVLATANRLPRSPRARRWLRRGGIVAMAALIAMLSWLQIDVVYPLYAPFLFVPLCIGLLLASLIAAPVRALRLLLELPALRWIGRLSYSLYLWHYPVIVILYPTPFVRQLWPFSIVAVLGVALGMAVVSYYVVELPFLRLKSRLTPATVPPSP